MNKKCDNERDDELREEYDFSKLEGGVRGKYLEASKMPAIVEISLDEIQRDLPAYIRRVEAGEILVILKAGEPVAELRPIASDSARLRPFGLCAGEVTVPDDFDAPLPGYIIEEFEGR